MVTHSYEFLYGYGSIPIQTIFRGMNIHLPAILMFTRGTRFWHTAIWIPGTSQVHVGGRPRCLVLRAGREALRELRLWMDGQRGSPVHVIHLGQHWKAQGGLTHHRRPGLKTMDWKNRKGLNYRKALKLVFLFKKNSFREFIFPAQNGFTNLQIEG